MGRWEERGKDMCNPSPWVPLRCRLCRCAALVWPPTQRVLSTQHHTSSTSTKMATACDISFDEMAMALSYISLGGTAAAPASSARGLPSLAPVKQQEKKPAKKPEADDDVRREENLPPCIILLILEGDVG